MGDHTESYMIEFDPNVVSYRTLCHLFFQSHNATAPMPRQYCSSVFLYSDEQARVYDEVAAEVQPMLRRNIVTRRLVSSPDRFTDAEGYHQHFSLRQNPRLLAEVAKVVDPSSDEFAWHPLPALLNAYAAATVDSSALPRDAPRLRALGLSARGVELAEAAAGGRRR
mmetsp:Transcript_237/g.791  ORF Transcript_237/g.791 Transcript_237/m.791 type:complete len:167 (-) Transcript_237:182-682(-)